MKFVTAFIVSLIVCFMIPWQTVSATGSTLEVRILPMECVFETVNDGSNQIIFVTPAECGQQIGPLLGPAGSPGQGQPPGGHPGQGQPPEGSGPPPATPEGSNQGQGRQDHTRTVPLRVTPRIFGTIPPQAELIDLPIHLDDYLGTRGATESQFILPLGEMVYFSAVVDGVTETHSVTIKEIGNDYIVITIASTPFDARLVLGQVKRFDASGNGQDDIEVALRTIADGMADITFRYIAASEFGGTTSLNEEEPVSESTVVNPGWLAFVVLTFLLTVIAISVSLLRRR